jgi:hypothetical protein
MEQFNKTGVAGIIAVHPNALLAIISPLLPLHFQYVCHLFIFYICVKKFCACLAG